MVNALPAVLDGPEAAGASVTYLFHVLTILVPAPAILIILAGNNPSLFVALEGGHNSKVSVILIFILLHRAAPYSIIIGNKL